MRETDVSSYKHPHLPHFERRARTYFVTFVTSGRQLLAPAQRDLVLARCIGQHLLTCYLDCVVVMPDHVHLLVFPFDRIALSDVLRRMKGGSSFDVNRAGGTAGRVWQRESFDHMLRSDESLAEKAEYIRQNPVRAGLVERAEDYPYFWAADPWWATSQAG